MEERNCHPSQVRGEAEEGSVPCTQYSQDPSHPTGTFAHSPGPGCQTPRSGSPCAPCGTGSPSSVPAHSFISAYDARAGGLHTFTYNSHTSIKNARIPSSFFASCNRMNLVSTRNQRSVSTQIIRYPLPGVTNADTVHSLNLSTPFRYLCTIKHLPLAGSVHTNIALSLVATSSITSKLALAII